MSRPPTELLVHIAAPSERSHDIGYKSLASAYSEFEPSKRTTLLAFSENNPVKYVRSVSSVNPNQGLADVPSSRHSGVVPLCGEDGLSFPSSNLSFKSVDDNLVSPRLRKYPGEHFEATGLSQSQTSWRPPPSVIEDSNPENNITLPRYCSPTRILEHFLRGFDSSQTSSVSQALELTENRDKSPQGKDPVVASEVSPLGVPLVSKAEGGLWPPTSSERENIAVVSEAPSLLVESRPEIESFTSQTKSGGSFGTISSFTFAEGHDIPSIQPMPAIGQVSKSGSEPPPYKRRKRESLAQASSSKALARSTSDIGPRRQPASKDQRIQRRDISRVPPRQSPDGLHIYSPEPDVSVQELQPSSLVTETLAKLARDLNIDQRYQPKEQFRDIRPFERGYWLVDCTAWTEQLREEAWNFLANYVGNGVAGWGIWCCRDLELTWMRLYCWGSLVGHMHLVLYLASQRRILYTGSTWVGGDGNVVVVMAPKTKRPPRQDWERQHTSSVC
ncbi:hypothetical protein VTK73DRAFT_1246 [Phialemonium thermophilum]|uniref:Uncharacterized protein n=1 Tax=Phialemonium thermophilum TaxID=223376 RepID=A0ABR3Y358_9PEZI